jgi:hypothetical protein
VPRALGARFNFFLSLRSLFTKPPLHTRSFSTAFTAFDAYPLAGHLPPRKEGAATRDLREAPNAAKMRPAPLCPSPPRSPAAPQPRSPAAPQPDLILVLDPLAEAARNPVTPSNGLSPAVLGPNVVPLPWHLHGAANEYSNGHYKFLTIFMARSSEFIITASDNY